MTANILARSEQTQIPVFVVQIDIINGALREAALAATANDALDITGNALRQLVDIARASSGEKSPYFGYLTCPATGDDAEVRHD
ncbi:MULTISPECIES: hypothetical protein [unclassified Caballeronia]|uniref:hypothetical protein n=1 Tax=unclassified Caballeronia TaxID=2646786 RepID=UPI002865A2B3|nr:MULTISPECIES: hypothetical protein [unclassified Caballeronia]MDR5777731.1 hypothetical protein [Caballeronia sp. LZ002]MDR5800577.1 hypothetical protein [Caballeronia sp. LZ001]MDR5802518.1 hypothetical protein [Caballeronia sp. LZ001]MDR5853161.1 hypothetical protein [Caballeronia sp. LZ003]